MFWRSAVAYSVSERALIAANSLLRPLYGKGIKCKQQYCVRSATCPRIRANATAIAAIARASKAFAFAWTANTIARNAGKPAKSALLQPKPNSMTDQPVRVAFHLDQDSRLVGVFCCAVEHQAMQAGFETLAGAELAKAAGDVCRETISRLNGNGECVDVTLDTFADRIEIAIRCHGQALPAVGLEAFAAPDAPAAQNGGINGQELLSRVDRVLYHAEDGVARTTLVKFLPARQ